MRVSTIAILLLISIVLMLSCSTDSTPVYQLNTSLEPTEAGSVTQSATETEEGGTITITANANEHWVFDRWSGDHSGTENPASILMDRDKNVTALFGKRDYPLTITIEGEGAVEQEIIQPKTTDYPHGTVVKLNAMPETGWAFIGWAGDIESTQNPYELTVSEETTITAVFEVITYPLTIETIGEGQVHQEIVQAKTTEYDYGTLVELTAVAEQHWVFLKWSGDVTGSENPVTITIDDLKNVTAEFERSFTLSTDIQPEGAGSITPNVGEYVRDTTFNVEAVANHGWKFERWEGDFSGSLNPFSLTMNGNKSLVAHFERLMFDLDITIEGGGAVNKELLVGTFSDGKYAYESIVNLAAIPNAKFVFDQWSGDINSSEDTIEIVIQDNLKINALFVEKWVEILDYSFPSGRELTNDKAGYFHYNTASINNFSFNENFKIEKTFDVNDIHGDDKFVVIMFNYLDNENYSAVFIEENGVYFEHKVNNNWNSDAFESVNIKYVKNERYMIELNKLNDIYTVNMQSFNNNQRQTLFSGTLNISAPNITNIFGFGVSDMTQYYESIKVYKERTASKNSDDNAIYLIESGEKLQDKSREFRRESE
ncbi:MAG: hypothetical protein JJU13_12475 [Balneolaceae bacterium]|nr:hypothetical protein [Balneolaceae bacterium]